MATAAMMLDDVQKLMLGYVPWDPKLLDKGG